MTYKAYIYWKFPEIHARCCQPLLSLEIANEGSEEPEHFYLPLDTFCAILGFLFLTINLY